MISLTARILKLEGRRRPPATRSKQERDKDDDSQIGTVPLGAIEVWSP